MKRSNDNVMHDRCLELIELCDVINFAYFFASKYNNYKWDTNIDDEYIKMVL